MAKMVEARVTINERYEVRRDDHDLRIEVRRVRGLGITAGVGDYARILQSLLKKLGKRISSAYGGRKVGTVAQYMVPENFFETASKEFSKFGGLG